MRRMLGVVALGLLGLLILGLATPDARADCGGPTIRLNPVAGAPGSTVVISGEGFGTNCYDTGPPPPGQGVLGVPQTGIELSVTDATFTRTVLATVDAGPQYRFRVQVSIPADAAPGPASVQAVGSSPFVPPAPFEVSGGVIPATPAYTG